MSSPPEQVRAGIAALAAEQAGVVARPQVLALGLSSSALGRRVAEGRWVTAHPGVYLVDGAELTPMARVWAALLHASSGRLVAAGQPRAAVAGRAALWLWGALDSCPDVVDVAVPAGRRVVARPRVRVVVQRQLRASAQRPPRLPLLVAALDVVHAARSEADVVDLVVTLTSRRLTTADRLAEAVARRRRLRRRQLLLSLCEEASDGVQSPLERSYLRDVERAHRLPTGQRNLREVSPSGGSWYRDVRYAAQRVVVELDGRAAHPTSEAFRDRRRDNHAARHGETVLRYGWREVVDDPCGIAAEVTQVLRLGGWRGAVRPCRPGCVAAVAQGEGSFPLGGNDRSA